MRPLDPHFKSSDHPPPLLWQPSCCPHSCALCTHLSAFFLFTAPKTSPWQINQCLVLSAQVTVNEADGAVPYDALCLPSLWAHALQFPDRGCRMANFSLIFLNTHCIRKLLQDITHLVTKTTIHQSWKKYANGEKRIENSVLLQSLRDN